MGKSIRSGRRLRAVAEQVVKSSKSFLSKAVPMDSTVASASGSSSGSGGGVPLSAVVADCAKRWFKETLQEAKAGDMGMQVLLGQMYYSGYGVPRDTRKGRLWITKASKIRSSVWSVRDKHPGYNASDSDSD